MTKEFLIQENYYKDILPDSILESVDTDYGLFISTEEAMGIMSELNANVLTDFKDYQKTGEEIRASITKYNNSEFDISQIISDEQIDKLFRGHEFDFETWIRIMRRSYYSIVEVSY